MATAYSDCYDIFLSNIDDVDILYPRSNESDSDYEDRIETLLLSLFKSAVVKFRHPNTSLSRDDNMQMFVNDLKDVEIEIIGLLMLREYYRKKLNFLVQLKHSFSDKDWKMGDKSNQMNQYRQLLKDTQSEIKELTIDNSYENDSGEVEWTE